MQPRMLVGAIAVAVWYLIWDMLLSEPILGSTMATVEGSNPSPPVLWIVIGNLAGGLVLAWFYSRVLSVFGTGVKSGLQFGLSAGVLMNFPLWLFMSVYDTGWPYAASWAMTVASIFWVTVAGLVLGMVYQKMPGAAAAT